TSGRRRPTARERTGSMNRSTEAKIGPGELVLIVGPSGAGKDTLIGLVRDRLAGDPAVVFPRRVVTRAPSPDEENEFLTETEFARRAQAGAFALSWGAHGLHYGVPG